MSKFRIDIQMAKVVDFTLFALEGEPVLQLAQATEANKPYFNGILRRSRRNMPQVKAGNINVDLVISNRANDRELYAKYVLQGWQNVVDMNGKAVPFSEAEALEFLQAIPSFIFDEIREFAAEPRNFILEELPEAEEIAKNLQSD